LIDITVAPAGQQAIMKEYKDVESIGNALPSDPGFKELHGAAALWS